MTEHDEFVERRIVIGMVVSTDYLRVVHQMWDPKLLLSVEAKLLASWCLEYFTAYNQAPKKDIEDIYISKLKGGLEKSRGEAIGQILQDLSAEYERKQFNLDYLLDETRQYFQFRHLKNFADDIQGELTAGSLTEAEKIASSFTPVAQEISNVIDPFNAFEKIRLIFSAKKKPLIEFPKVLGRFWNDQMIREAFVAILGSEKKGKSFWLLEFALRGITSGCNVAFFEGGDMSEDQLLKRLCIYLAKRSDNEKYCEGMFIPVLDCVFNQLDTCKKSERECMYGVFESHLDLKKITYEEVTKAFRENPEYKPCRNCKEWRGAVWFKWRDEVPVLTEKVAIQRITKFNRLYKQRLRLCAYPNETLTLLEIKSLLDKWERQDGFVPDIIIIDYADILASDPDCARLDFRNQQNKIWQRLRRLSQEKHCLVITATQAAATSYKRDLLTMTDFSEDKRKFAHVTAMYGLNQNEAEKKIGIMRINEIVVREGDFDRTTEVKVLQRLQMGRPFLGSFK